MTIHLTDKTKNKLKITYGKPVARFLELHRVSMETIIKALMVAMTPEELIEALKQKKVIFV